uniref:Uncharacterized protein n=1 Tax=Glossina brevipalpis TaxID=37001 RepID=A0A1A9W0M5_9MUSC
MICNHDAMDNHIIKYRVFLHYDKECFKINEDISRALGLTRIFDMLMENCAQFLSILDKFRMYTRTRLPIPKKGFSDLLVTYIYFAVIYLPGNLLHIICGYMLT